MKKVDVFKDMEEAQRLNPRLFSFTQLLKISDENNGVLNRCIDLTSLSFHEAFVLVPVMYHHHGYGKPMKKHLRTRVQLMSGTRLAFQDLTLEQWNQGFEIIRMAS